MKHITQRQKEILDFIIQYSSEKKYPPSYRDIAANFGMTAASAKGHVAALKSKNVISHTPYVSRSIVVLEAE